MPRRPAPARPTNASRPAPRRSPYATPYTAHPTCPQHRRAPARSTKLQDSLHSKPDTHRTTKPFLHPARGSVRMFASIRPRPTLLYEHVFCSLATSTLAQRTRGALALTRAFLLLEDDDPVDWEVDREDRGISAEPPWARAHRMPLRGRRVARRPGRPHQRPQVCLCPIASQRPVRRAVAARSPAPVCPVPQRGARITTGSSRVAIDL